MCNKDIAMIGIIILNTIIKINVSRVAYFCDIVVPINKKVVVRLSVRFCWGACLFVCFVCLFVNVATLTHTTANIDQESLDFFKYLVGLYSHNDLVFGWSAGKRKFTLYPVLRWVVGIGKTTLYINWSLPVCFFVYLFVNVRTHNGKHGLNLYKYLVSSDNELVFGWSAGKRKSYYVLSYVGLLELGKQRY